MLCRFKSSWPGCCAATEHVRSVANRRSQRIARFRRECRLPAYGGILPAARPLPPGKLVQYEMKIDRRIFCICCAWRSKQGARIGRGSGRKNLRRQIADNWKGVKRKTFGKSIVVQISPGREEIFACGATADTCQGQRRAATDGGRRSCTREAY